MVDAGGLALMPGIIDIHTHYDAQVTWDPTLSPSPSLGVTTVVTGNCGFGIVPSPPHLRDLIMRNLAIVEGMDLDALRTGIDWRFELFAEYLDAVRRAGPYANVAVLVGHSAVRTAVMGDDASVRKYPTAAELAEMKQLVADAMAQGAIGLGSSYSSNHSGWGGIPMPSTISDIAEFDALVSAMGGPGRGVVEIASGTIAVETIADIAGRHGRRMFMTTGCPSTTSSIRSAASACSRPAPWRRRGVRRFTCSSPASRCRSILRWLPPIHFTATLPSTQSRHMVASS